MTTWNELSSIITTLTGSAVAFLAIGCLWPHRPQPPSRPNSQRRCAYLPPEWSCATPSAPFDIATAHHWMQVHRDHDCARKRAAFAALIAAGRITPDSARYRHEQ